MFDNCSIHEKLELERIQQEAARIVTGATKLISIDKLMCEVGWESLEKRRHKHKLIMFYKMKNNLTPAYLSDLVPPLVGDENRYHLRNADHIQNIRTRTDSYYRSFLPSVIREYNQLSEQIRQATSLTSFKRLLNNDLPVVPKYFLIGERKLQILHTRLRTNCSSLRSDLFNKNIIDSPLCECGVIENASHFFLTCDKYINSRRDLLNTITQLCEPSLNIILNGNPLLSFDSNASLFQAVHTYIRETRRFVD